MTPSPRPMGSNAPHPTHRNAPRRTVRPPGFSALHRGDPPPHPVQPRACATCAADRARRLGPPERRLAHALDGVWRALAALPETARLGSRNCRALSDALGEADAAMDRLSDEFDAGRWDDPDVGGPDIGGPDIGGPDDVGPGDGDPESDGPELDGYNGFGPDLRDGGHRLPADGF